MKIGVVGNGMIVGMFLHDAALVEGADIVSLCVRPNSLDKGQKIAEEHQIPLVETDSRLGWEPSMEYMGDKARIEWKIRHTKYLIETEIGNQKRSALLGGEV